MHIRFRVPSKSGTGVVTLKLDDELTVAQLIDAIKVNTGFGDVKIRFGFPPKALTADQDSQLVQSLDLHKESLTVDPIGDSEPRATPTNVTESAAPSASTTATADGSLSNLDRGQEDVSDVTVPMPENAEGSLLVLRVMPDDGACMFSAVGGALPGIPRANGKDTSPSGLREIVVKHIENHPYEYTEAVLEKEPSVYCKDMRQGSTWGGGIELRIISEVFQIEIAVINVQSNKVIRFGEDRYSLRCILIWSNIHYDRVAEVYCSPHWSPDADITRWEVGKDRVLVRAQELARMLRDKHHYYTDTVSMVVACNQCQWVGQGEKAIAEHASKTGHTNIQEIPDSEVNSY